MQAPEQIHELVDRFRRNEKAYTSSGYKEAELRQEFLNPLFSELGWDVYNESGYAEPYKDVVHEASLSINGGPRAPDYSFRIGGQRKFFVEAKKPSLGLKDGTAAAFQVRRYGWSANLPLSILTDFEEWAVYDCTVRPEPSDTPSTARVHYLTYDEYPSRWDDIASVFSKEAILQGSFDTYAKSTRDKRGTAQVDTAFLAEIEGWREGLAAEIAERNTELSVRELNLVVQRIIDRIVFLRIAEDRAIEPYGELRDALDQTKIYPRLLKLFRRADKKYNSGLFHFEQERNRATQPDTLSTSIAVGNRPLTEIIEHLYYPHSPYEFSVIPSEILGKVYETFLGRVITLTDGRSVTIQEKPEVRKQGGVYYTPRDIVDDIIGLTLQAELANRSLDNIESLAVVDPACGSGSFLLAAYRYLLDWYLERYLAEGGPDNALIEGPDGSTRLSTDAKKRILRSHIFGVDVDPQAVEVTKLALLLTVLENETSNTLEPQIQLFAERALPDLGNNIKCGNSLIEPDFFGVAQGELLEEVVRYEINPFSWDEEFESLFSQERNGFDVVIGNPPYVLLQSLDRPVVEEYLKEHFATASYKLDTYQLFLERATEITAEGGRLAFITPNTFLRNKFSQPLRELLLRQTEIEQLILHDYSVFQGASVDTCILSARIVDDPDASHTIQVHRSLAPDSRSFLGHVPQSSWESNVSMQFSLPKSRSEGVLIDQLHRAGSELGNFATAYFGIQTYGREEWVSDEQLDESWKPALDGSNIGRYSLSPPEEYVCTKDEAIKSGKRLQVFENRRIGVRQIGAYPIATILPGGWYSLNTIYNVYFTEPVWFSLEYILGILNSRLMRWLWLKEYYDQKRQFPKIKKRPLLSLPIPGDPGSREGESLIPKCEQLAESIIELNGELANSQSDYDTSVIRREVRDVDRRLDESIFDLYGLNSDDVKLIRADLEASDAWE